MKFNIIISKLFCFSKHQGFSLLFVTSLILSSISCSDDRERHVTVDKPRPLTVVDETKSEVVESPQLSSVGSYKYAKPSHWVDQAATPFRKLNFTFGSAGEVYLSESRGGILPNVNRWLGQFGVQPAASEDDLETISVLSTKGYWVSAQGAFRGMRMRESLPNYMLLGVLVEIDGELITIKMTGPASEVEKEATALRAFCESLAYVNE